MNAGLAAVIADAPEAAGGGRLLDASGWSILTRGDPALGFLGLWVSGDRAFCIFDYKGDLLLLATPLVEASYPSITAGFTEAAWFERLARDSTGITSSGAVDRRPAIAHDAGGSDAGWPRFIETPAERGYQIGQGPVAGLIAQPVHRRFSLDGQKILRLEHRLGYAHRGVIGLMRGKSPRVAARFAARITGDATVAHAVAFARAAEAASRMAVPPRAEALRMAMLGIERITADLAALAMTVELAGDAAFAALLGCAREAIAAAVGQSFGHRLMMDIVVPGGLALEIENAALPVVVRALDRARRAVRGIGWARVQRDLSAAAGVALVRARSVGVLVAEVRTALVPSSGGIIAQSEPAATGTALGAAPSARGMVHHWLDLEGGAIRDGFFIDPSARLLSRLEAAVVGLELDDATLLAACYGLAIGAIDG